MNQIFSQLNAIGAETADALERFLDDEEMYLKYIHDFPTDPTMGRIVAAMQAKDYPAAKDAVHAFKGIVNNLGFVSLADPVLDMLEELRADNVPDAIEAYAEVQKQYARYTGVLNDWISRG